MNKTHIAIIIPYYKSESTIEKMYVRIKESLGPISKDWALIFIDDNSPDDGWSVIEKLANQDSRVKGLKLSRNFGQHPAITAGIHYAKADWYVVMDCDLQDRPEDIPRLYNEAISKDVNIVIAERERHALGKKRKLGSVAFNSLLSWVSDLEVSEQIGNFRIFSENVAQAYRSFPEQFRFFPAIMAEIGFHPMKLLLPRDDREVGESSYSFGKLINLAIEAIISYSDKPLKLMVVVGSLVSIGAVIIAIVYFICALLGMFKVQGFASLFIALISFSGLQVALISLVGLYTGQVLREAKERPIYIVEKSI